LVGAKPHAANLVKLSGNLLITSVIESLGETMALVGKAGIDQRQYLDVLCQRFSPRRFIRPMAD
jgi:3-hydroxyisobutyrate dehydrogenase-like beta-hydroxyacid dehydrogenase